MARAASGGVLQARGRSVEVTDLDHSEASRLACSDLSRQVPPRSLADAPRRRRPADRDVKDKTRVGDCVAKPAVRGQKFTAPYRASPAWELRIRFKPIGCA